MLYYDRRRSNEYVYGFTLVEILVVAAVIFFLTTIGVIAYSNWRVSVNIAQIKNDLNSIVSAMEDARNFYNGYPEGIPASFIPSEGTVLSGGGSADHKTYCVSANVDGIMFKVTDTNTEPTYTADSC